MIFRCLYCVLIVDDLVLICCVLVEGIECCLELEVVGFVLNGVQVNDLLVIFQLDVIMFDFEMLNIDGLMFLWNYLCKCLILIVVIFLVINGNNSMVIQVVEVGVVDIISKLCLNVNMGLVYMMWDVCDCIVIVVKLCLCFGQVCVDVV